MSVGRQFSRFSRFQSVQQRAGIVFFLEVLAHGDHLLDFSKGFLMPLQGIECDGDVVSALGLAVGERLCIAHLSETLIHVASLNYYPAICIVVFG